MRDELIRQGEVAFGKPLERAAIRDRRLSWGARGLFIFLWDLPAGWQPNIEHLASQSPDGRDAVSSRLKELKQVGALKIEPRRERGKITGRDWILRAPRLWAIEAPLATTGFSDYGKTGAGKSDTKVLQEKGLQTEEQQQGHVVVNANNKNNNNNGSALHEFLDAADPGRRIFSDDDVELIGASIADASLEQARWAGESYAATTHVTNPIGLARRLARLAAAGKVGKPVCVADREVAAAAAASSAEAEARHRKALEASARAVQRDAEAEAAGRRLLDRHGVSHGTCH